MLHHVWRLTGALCLFFTAAVGSAAAGTDESCLNVVAKGGWQSTGVSVGEGDRVCILAKGLWSHGPESGDVVPWHDAEGYLLNESASTIVPFPFAKVGELLARLGETGLAFPVGKRLCFVARTTDGLSGLPADLYLAMNDVPDGFDNNRGAMRVAIAVADRDRWADGRGDFDRLAHRAARGSCLD